MSGDEILVLIGAAAVALGAWARWYYLLSRSFRLRPAPTGALTLLRAAPLVCVAAIFAVLKAFSAEDVRDSGVYLLFYTVLGLAWVGAARGLILALGYSVRDDAVERGNPAAALVLFGTPVGVALCYAGGNIGNGPGWWVVVFAGLLSTAGFFFLLALLEAFTRRHDDVTIGRDAAAGWRLLGVQLAAGLVLGRAVAGDWVSASATVRDFLRVGTPTLLLIPAEMGAGMLNAPRPASPHPHPFTAGTLPAAMYVAAAIVYLVRVGWW